jgi:8-oxo-dGTP diphosphatase
MIIAGVDGCKSGWIMVKYVKDVFSYGIYDTMQELFSENYDLQRVLVDIPVGLASANLKRSIEQDLRRELKYRHSTVFNPPCREALYTENYSAARKVNMEVEGKSLSIQSLAIKDKIRETDEFLQKSSGFAVIESHPELCFKYLNEGRVLMSKKSTHAGLEDRLRILRNYLNIVDELFERIVNNTQRKSAAKDDIVDAICLCVVNKLSGKGNMKFIRDKNRVDAEGIEMKIGYFNPLN